MGVCLTPVQWISAYHAVIGMPLFHYTILRSSDLISVEMVIDIINKYKVCDFKLRYDVMWVMSVKSDDLCMMAGRMEQPKIDL